MFYGVMGREKATQCTRVSYEKTFYENESPRKSLSLPALAICTHSMLVYDRTDYNASWEYFIVTTTTQ